MDTSNEKKYVAPVLVTLGSASQLTQNVNENGPGDVLFNILRQS